MNATAGKKISKGKTVRQENLSSADVALVYKLVRTFLHSLIPGFMIPGKSLTIKNLANFNENC